MDIFIKRRPSAKGATIGELSIAGDTFTCFTLEDEVREVQGQPVEKWKIAGRTAIGRGRYQITITMSAHFGRLLPLLLKVLGYVGVRLHPGNNQGDTEGCILVGLETAGNLIFKSRAAFDILFKKIAEAIAGGQQVWVTIT